MTTRIPLLELGSLQSRLPDLIAKKGEPPWSGDPVYTKAILRGTAARRLPRLAIPTGTAEARRAAATPEGARAEACPRGRRRSVAGLANSDRHRLCCKALLFAPAARPLWFLEVADRSRRWPAHEGDRTMAKSITQKFGAPTLGKRSKKHQATADVAKPLPRKGVVLMFTGESATKPWLKKGRRLTMRGSLTCHGSRYLRVECAKPGAKKPVVFCIAPAAAEAK
jgi:hypothetical protein